MTQDTEAPIAKLSLIEQLAAAREHLIAAIEQYRLWFEDPGLIDDDNLALRRADEAWLKARLEELDSFVASRFHGPAEQNRLLEWITASGQFVAFPPKVQRNRAVMTAVRALDMHLRLGASRKQADAAIIAAAHALGFLSYDKESLGRAWRAENRREKPRTTRRGGSAAEALLGRLIERPVRSAVRDGVAFAKTRKERRPP